MLGDKKGDALKADRIYCQARKILIRPPTKGSHSHRAKTAVLESIGREAAFCFVEKEFRFAGQFKL